MKNTRLLDLETPPVIGEIYLVPCISMYIGKTREYEFVPIIGQAHSDPELGNDSWHGHLDVRFATDDEIRKYTHVDPIKIRNASTNLNFDIPIFSLHVQQPKIEEVSKVCVGECLDLRSCMRSDSWMINRYVPNYDLHTVMENEQEHKKLDLKCKICPHRGVQLNSVAPTDGVLTCPGHGLQWSITTGELVRKTGKKARHIYKVEK